MRLSLVAVSVFVFLAAGNLMVDVGKIVSIQILVIIGAYVIPIPGAIGITDYIMIDGLQKEDHTILEMKNSPLIPMMKTYAI